MERRLEDKVAMVTGAGRGIGEAIARRLAAEGALVWVADRDEAPARAVAASLDRATPAFVDIAADTSVAALGAMIAARHRKLDILVNNAAILDLTPLDALSIARFAEVQDINLTGALRVTLTMLPLLRNATSGARILNIASVNGLRGTRDNLAYSAAKGGLVNMTRCLAVDLAPDDITVNAIAPGFIHTRMAVMADGVSLEHESDWFKTIYIEHRRIPLARGGNPDDIAGPAFFFCSDDSRYVTGQTLPVDGGMLSTF